MLENDGAQKEPLPEQCMISIQEQLINRAVLKRIMLVDYLDAGEQLVYRRRW